ncbi:DUF1549 domain-containing protein [Prosthecobacter dejongeii]|uniref:Cytochrome c domain-containing protein n=1 Tax=Prosthecobacter dejongeii TaxID=48465 RepID=A0A7W8DSI7_9BACT|nr:DUF1549 domain-containing protein [Prosthecobacter dejongeii]MBB5040355.1 hypothetical protein [Prosthecobacter dejongeii]
MKKSLCILFLSAVPAWAAIDFAHQIVPVLRKHCAECHMGDKKKGGFSMNDRGSLMTGGEKGLVVNAKVPHESMLLDVVTTEDKELRMPPKGPGLTKDEITLLKQWVAEGLPWEAGFAFKKPAYEPPLKPRQVNLPSAMDGRENPVDRLVDAYFVERKLARPKMLEDGAFMRRAYLDLIGLLPMPEELADFQADKTAGKRERLVQSLLARDVDYAEHWLTFWNDLLRNDYGGTGFITGGRKQISKWLYESLVNNKRFDQFTRELIAPPTDDSRGFIDGIKWRGEVSAGQTVEIQFAQSVGQSFLGINLKCASCHDSFVDRWKLDEAYGLAAIYAEKPLDIHRCDKPVGRQAKAGWLFPEIGNVEASAPRAERLQQLAALMTHPENGRFTRTIVNRLWHRLMGRGIVHPLDAMDTPPWNADLLDFLATHLQKNEYDLKQTLQLIATSQIYQSRGDVMTGEAEDAAYVFKGVRSKRLTAEQFLDAVWRLTGAAPSKMDASVFRGKPDPALAQQIQLQGKWIWGDSALPGNIPPAGEKILLRKILKLDQAVAAGSAIMTCDNGFSLYINGRKVTGSENWEQIVAVPLADKLVVGPNTLVVIATNAGKGPNPAGLYFEARLKLADGKEISVTTDDTWEWNATIPEGKEGRLGAVAAKSWKPVVVVKTLGAWKQRLDSQGPALLAQGGKNGHLMVRASLLKSDFLMRSLGRPNRDQIVSMRPNEITTLEALDLSNGEALTTTLARGAETLAARDWKTPEALVNWIYESVLSRDPTSTELQAALEAIGEKPTVIPIQDLLWAVVMQPEFLFVR